MEFNEKLQELRKNRGLTQEELAELLFVSRAAVSKWESGRGYPNIESLKEIAKFFSVSIDELLSGEKLLSIAEREKKADVRKICDLLFGFADLLSLLLVILPLYPNTVNGFVYSVNLFGVLDVSTVSKAVYAVMFAALILSGLVKLILTRINAEKPNKILTEISVMLNILTVLFLTVTRAVYAAVVAFFILVIKAVLLKR
ncbi:MAG: helix-turn-helix transcriptional regulator [Clostridia bacterium]|nr:helix-turn-helix transcriptional regulator [Clostridia bacterium]